MTCSVVYIYKAEDRQTYAIQIGDVAYIPVLSSVYESGTDHPMAISKRLISTGARGFWTTGVIDDRWQWIDIEDITHESWKVFIELSIELFINA